MIVLLLSFRGNPVGKGRPRATVRGRHATIYTDQRTRSYEKSVTDVATAFMGERAPLIGGLSVTMRFRLPCPVSYSKRVRAALLSGESPYTGGPDLDNMVKAILDALNGVCFEDDRQVVRSFQTKVASEAPGVDVRIEALEPQPADSGH